jgi:hypothetical protein
MLLDLANLPYWVLLGTGVALFLLVIASGGTDEDIDLEVDGDINLDVDNGVLGIDTNADVDLDEDLDVEENGGFIQILAWLGVGKVPLLLLLAIYLSVWGLIGWIINSTTGTVIGKMPGGLLRYAIFFFSLIISIAIGKTIATPLGKMFASFGEDVSSERLLGCVGTVICKQVPYITEGKIGQADVYDQSHNLTTVSISLPHWATVVPVYGQQILIIDKSEHGYLVIAKDTSDEDRWLLTVTSDQ